jgi:hypothetical protein
MPLTTSLLFALLLFVLSLPAPLFYRNTVVLPLLFTRCREAVQDLLPVLVYIHGGYLHFGSGHEVHSSPSAELAQELGAVLVSFNYRLNVFGWLALKVSVPSFYPALSFLFADICETVNGCKTVLTSESQYSNRMNN